MANAAKIEVKVEELKILKELLENERANFQVIDESKASVSLKKYKELLDSLYIKVELQVAQ
ncbi:MAG TPA: hypothetical protein VLI05_05630 [Candidatus Saccharimonadia bacterium]|nr:hypothetical protein [Candidatus Saccharimonadia bacterium]